MRYRSAAARDRAILARMAAETQDAAERDRLRTRALALLTPWERALYELHIHFDGCRHYYGCIADDLLVEFARGCGCVRTFRQIVVSIFDLEHGYAPGMLALVQAARDGTVGSDLAGREVPPFTFVPTTMNSSTSEATP